MAPRRIIQSTISLRAPRMMFRLGAGPRCDGHAALPLFVSFACLGCERLPEALATPGRPGVRVIAKQFGVNPGTVQRISRPFEQDAVAL
jgi:hypothetical protein